MPLILVSPYLKKLAALIGEAFSVDYDPYFAQVTALLPLRNDLLDVKANFLTNINTTLSTAKAKFGSRSAYFGGDGDMLRFNGSTLADFGTGDFTIEGWVHPESYLNHDSNLIQGSVILSQYSGASNWRWFLNMKSTGTEFIVQNTGGTVVLELRGPIIPLNEWSHVAICRKNGLIRLYVKGIGGMVVSSTLNYNFGAQIGVGYFANAAAGYGGYFKGFMEDIRFTRMARYEADFAVPKSQFDIFGYYVEGWDIAWAGRQNEYNTTATPAQYDLSLANVSARKRVAIAYVDSTVMGKVTPIQMHSFDLPEKWKVQHPFNYLAEDLNIEVKEENTGVVKSGMLRYGTGNFSSRITDPWSGNGWGRIGITNTTAPYYTGFGSANTDYAPLSNQAYSATAGGPMRRFAILVQK